MRKRLDPSEYRNSNDESDGWSRVSKTCASVTAGMIHSTVGLVEQVECASVSGLCKTHQGSCSAHI